MDFLALVKRTARESGTIAGSGPSTVSNQTGQNLLCVEAVQHAYELIQNAHAGWRWLRAEFSTTITAATPPTEARYTAAGFGLTRFAEWWRDAPGYRPMRLYQTATGVADESKLKEIEWETWKDKWGFGSVSANRPTEWAVAPDLRLCLGPPPNAAFTLRGEYQKGNQTLSDNTDTPEMPSQFHMAIVWRAVLLLTEHDEAAVDVYVRAENKFAEIMGQLERVQLPQITIGGSPLA